MVTLDSTGLDQALARAGDGVFVIGEEGRIALWNRAAEKILGYAAREVVGKACCDVFRGCDDRGNRLCYQGCQTMTLARMGEPVHSFDMRTQTKGGKPVWLNFSILAVPAQANNGPGPGVVVHLFRDVTATKELLTLVHERLTAAATKDDGVAAAATLTRRELEILRMLATGASTKGAADRLHLSRVTVRNHVQNILGKLDVHSRLEAVAYANRHRLL